MLFIDEANLLYRLTEHHEGKNVLSTFLQWLVSQTKQDRTLSVILNSSDPFFLNWITQEVGAENHEPVFIGDLSSKDAKLFYEQQRELRKPASIPPFEKVHEILGGRMHDIFRYLNEFALTSVWVGHWSPYQLAIANYRRAVRRPTTYCEETGAGVQKPPPAEWTTSQLTAAIKAIVANFGSVTEESLLQKMPLNVIHSMYQHNLLVPRPCARRYLDMPIADDHPIVVAPSPMHLAAMRELVRRAVSSNEQRVLAE